MYAEIIAAVESAKALGTLLKTANTLSNYNELVAAVSEVNSKLMAATGVALSSQEKQATLANRVAELEGELLKLRSWEKEISRYSLQSFPPGVLAFALKPEMANGEPPHLLCANCANCLQKSYLQVLSEGEYGKSYKCHKCESVLHVEYSRPPRTASSDYDPFANPDSWMG